MKKIICVLLPALLSGCSYYHQLVEQGQTKTLEYQCDETALFLWENDTKKQVSLVVAGEPLILDEGLSASGKRYSDGVYVYWAEGEQATLYRRDRTILHNCVLRPEAQQESLFKGDFLNWNKNQPPSE